MEFSCPPNLDFATEMKRPDFKAFPLQINEPGRYSHLLPWFFTKLSYLGIIKYFPPNWTLIPPTDLVPPANPLLMPAYQAAVAAKETLAVKHDYIYPSQSQIDYDVLRIHLNEFNVEQAQIATALILGDVIIPIVPHFGQPESARMALALQSITFEINQRDKETAICGPIITELKESVSLSLGQKLDVQTETDRPGFPRSPNFIIRAAFGIYEICCRGDPRDYSSTLKTLFNSIGKACTKIQASFVFDQFDYFKTIMFTFILYHPGAIDELPVDRSYLKAVYFRLTDVLELRDLRRILKSALDKETAEYDPTIESLRKSIRTKLPCSSDPPSINSETNDRFIPPYQTARVSYECAPHSTMLRSEVKAMCHQHHPNSNDHSAMQMSQLSHSSYPSFSPPGPYQVSQHGSPSAFAYSPNAIPDHFQPSFPSPPNYGYAYNSQVSYPMTSVQQAYALGGYATTIGAPQPDGNPLFPPVPQWLNPSSTPNETRPPPQSNGRCNQYPMCYFRGPCRYTHLVCHGRVDPAT